MRPSITSVYQRGIGLVWAIQLPHTVIYTRDGSLDSAEKKLAEIKKEA